jgi:hypothetical protein
VLVSEKSVRKIALATPRGLTRRGFGCGLMGGAVFIWERSSQARTTRTLFVVRRSGNRNTVYFDLPSPVADQDQPLQIYWRLFQEGDGRVEPLNWLERRLAYGYEVTQGRKRDVIQVTFAACPARPMEIHFGPRPQAVMGIAGVLSALREVYVTADETGLIPSVKYVDLVGVALATGLSQRERIPV